MGIFRYSLYATMNATVPNVEDLIRGSCHKKCHMSHHIRNYLYYSNCSSSATVSEEKRPSLLVRYDSLLI